MPRMRTASAQNSVYMNGATAEPCASTIRTPNRAMTMTIGHSQNFLRVRRNAHSSLINDIGVSQTSELVPHGIRRRAGWFAYYPVRSRVVVELEPQRILSGESHDQRHGREHTV